MISNRIEHYKISIRELRLPLFFLISLTMVGLQVPLFLGQALTIAIMLYSFRKCKYEFAVQLLLFMVAFGLFSQGEKDFFLYFKTYDIFVIICPILILLSDQRTTLYRQVKTATIVFLLILFLYLVLHDEPFSIQFRRYREIMLLLVFIVPVYIFKKEKSFSMQTFFGKLYSYGLVLAIFVLIQTFLLSKTILIPDFVNQLTVTWTDVINGSLFHFGYNERIYPRPFYFIVFSLFFWNFLRVPLRQKSIFFMAILSTLTRTLWVAILALFLVRSKFSSKIKIGLLFVITFFLLFTIDSNFQQVDLRTKDLVTQFSEIIDGANVSQFGTGRVAQAIAPFKHLVANKKLLTGFGFVHPEESKNLIIYNPHLVLRKGSIIGIENTQFNLLMMLGVVGVIFYYSYFLLMIFLMRKHIYGDFYRDLIVFFFVLGIGGFSGLTDFRSTALLGFMAGLLIVNNRFNSHGTTPQINSD